MQCLDCGEREATVVYVVGAPRACPAAPAEHARQRDADADGASPPELPSPHGPNVCIVCAQRRYESTTPPGAPTWEEFLAMAPEPGPQRRAATVRRRLGNVVLGAGSGGAAGWLAALLAGVDGMLLWCSVGGLAALGAALGYRYGRGVVKATFKALGEAADD